MRRIIWFRRDLRAEDNPLLSHEGDILPIFIFDTDILEKLSPNDRRVTFIFNALIRLKENLKTRGLDLALFYGKPTDVFRWLLAQESYHDVCASGDYDPYARQRDRDVSHLLPFTYLRDTYLFEPDEVLKNDGSPYLVFTPFYNRAKALFHPEHMAEAIAAPQTLIPYEYEGIHHIDGDTHTLLPPSLSSLGFSEQPLTPHQKLLPEEKLKRFASKLSHYPHDRDFMALDATSGLSSDLRFGTISIRRVLRWLVEQKKSGVDTEPFFRQLIFREFYAMLLAHFPRLTTQNFRYPFKGIENSDYFEAFFTARTGVPIVDAGIRELLSTGEMHNRVRMICASFFTKNLLLPWQWGERFFAEHLMDYDASSNILSWQWSAGTGVDPQPYFRIFNPYTQSGKFDQEGLYIKTHLPALSNVPTKVFSDEAALTKYTWDDYPHPIVDHRQSSKSVLEHFKSSL
ncbi:MAG: DNA photolyase family protein [Sulfuricurvum sp.]|jgi:deoxyribodipyrimidine photo-lyase|uniref:cryptochrome/photolyase family protein n=1 Tax=Sulfuricurvum sp. TaxID=2025608 RepID=UPI0025E0092D|nr:deoxyribodipyrimidine photo-lyase [Sulfuricurvum sp.]MCK9372366.1 DNA photolyase family protein [Sulfuricurvum sp.]